MNTKCRATWLVAVLVLVATLGWASTAVGDTTPVLERRISPETATQSEPAVWGTNVVYADSGRSMAGDIYLYDLALTLERRLTASFESPESPAIWGTSVVYENTRVGNTDIYLYDLTTGVERRLTSAPAEDVDPAIWGTYVVYETKIAPNPQIRFFELVTGIERQLTTGPSMRPAIWGTNVVYEDGRTGDGDIYLYELTTGAERRLTPNSAWQGNPDIWGRYVVFEDYSFGNADIHLYDLATGDVRNLTPNGANQRNPDIWGTHVVYEDYRNGNADIYLYDLASGIEWQLTTNAQAQTRPAISGPAVVYEDERTGTHDIYLGELATPHLSLSGPSVVGYGAPGVFSGTLTSVSGIPAQGRRVRLEFSYNGGWTWNPGAATYTDPLGRFTIGTGGIPSTLMVRAAFDGDGAYFSAQTEGQYLTSTAWLTKVSAARRAARSYRFTGYVKPRQPAGTAPVRITRWRWANGRWRSYGSSWAKVSDYADHSKYSMYYRFPYKGRWRLQAYFPGSASNAATKSAYTYVTVW